MAIRAYSEKQKTANHIVLFDGRTQYYNNNTFCIHIHMISFFCKVFLLLGILVRHRWIKIIDLKKEVADLFFF